MSKRLVHATLVAAFCIAAAAQAQTVGTSAYLVDTRGVLAKSGTGLCWRTGYWTPAMAIAECDPDLVKREEPKAAEKMPEPVKAAPAPAPAAAAAPKPVTVVIKGSFFDSGKAVLKAPAKEQLDKEVVAKIKEFGQVKQVIVSGHSDRMGKAAGNQKLSEKRADAVKVYLVGKGVAADKIETMGFGATQPAQGVAKCDDKLPKAKLAACLEPHRRVVVEIVPGSK